MECPAGSGHHDLCLATAGIMLSFWVFLFCLTLRPVALSLFAKLFHEAKTPVLARPLEPGGVTILNSISLIHPARGPSTTSCESLRRVVSLLQWPFQQQRADPTRLKERLKERPSLWAGWFALLPSPLHQQQLADPTRLLRGRRRTF